MLRSDVTECRSVPPEETVRRAMAFAPLLGITRVADVTGLDRIGIPVVMVCRPASRSLSVSQGKGLTIAAARASGLMESIELHHAERITRPVRLASYRDLAASGRVTDPTLLVRQRTSRFTPDASIPWIEAVGVRSGRAQWVPLELVDLDSRLPRAYPGRSFVSSSNGLASGNDRTEATVHGLAEVIERDAESLWRLGDAVERDSTRLALESVDDPTCRALLTAFDAAGLAVAVWTITSDLGVAAFSCILTERDVGPFGAVGAVEGSGCHPDRRVALIRALTEAAQSRLTSIAGSRDDMRRALVFEALTQAEGLKRFAADLERPGEVCFGSVPTVDPDGNRSADEDLRRLITAAESAGFGEPLIVDLTSQAVGIPVVKVIAPGLEGIHHRLAQHGPRGQATLDRHERAR